MDAVKKHSKPTLAAIPHLSIGPVNHGNNKGKSIDSVITLTTMLFKPSYLHQISSATFANADIKKLVELAQGLSPEFQIVHCGGVPLVV